MGIILFKSVERAFLVAEFKKEPFTTPYFKSPNEWDIIEKNRLYSNRYSGTHTHVFLIDDSGVVWYKIPSQSLKWKPLYWDKYLTRKARYLYCDGANLGLVDNLGELHYRKIIEERRTKDGEYEWKDMIGTSNYWYQGWGLVMFPLDNLTPSLLLDADVRNNDYEISHRGVWNSFVITKQGEKLYDHEGGCSSFFHCDGEQIQIADPMILSGFSVAVPLPQKLYRGHIASSASMIVYFGWDGSKKWKFWKKMLDLDIMGKVFFRIKHVRASTEWISLPDLIVPPSFRLGGRKMYNFGNNKRQLRIWFIDGNRILKCKIGLNSSKDRWHCEEISF